MPTDLNKIKESLENIQTMLNGLNFRDLRGLSESDPRRSVQNLNKYHMDRKKELEKDINAILLNISKGSERTQEDKMFLPYYLNKVSADVKKAESVINNKLSDQRTNDGFRLMKNPDVQTVYRLANTFTDVKIAISAISAVAGIEKDIKDYDEFIAEERAYDDALSKFEKKYKGVDFEKALEELEAVKKELAALNVTKEDIEKLEQVNKEKAAAIEKYYLDIEKKTKEQGVKHDEFTKHQDDMMNLDRKISSLEKAPTYANKVNAAKAIVEAKEADLKIKIDERGKIAVFLTENQAHLGNLMTDTVKKYFEAGETLKTAQTLEQEYQQLLKEKAQLSSANKEEFAKKEKEFITKNGIKAKSLSDKAVGKFITDAVETAKVMQEAFNPGQAVLEEIKSRTELDNQYSTLIDYADREITLAEGNLNLAKGEFELVQKELGKYCKDNGIEPKDFAKQLENAKKERKEASDAMEKASKESGDIENQIYELQGEQDKLTHEIESNGKAVKDIQAKLERAEKLRTREKELDEMEKDCRGIYKEHEIICAKCEKLTEKHDATKGNRKQQVENLVTDKAKDFLERVDDAKGKHKNSAEYEKVVSALKELNNKNSKLSLNDRLAGVEKAATNYLEAKNKQLFHFNPSELRCTRLKFAESLVQFAKSSAKSIDMVPLDRARVAKELKDDMVKRYGGNVYKNSTEFVMSNFGKKSAEKNMNEAELDGLEK